MICRFIYVYRECSSGKAVYVGSAFDIASRHATHVRNVQSAFDRALALDPSAFTVHTLDSVAGRTKAEAMLLSVDRENFWMDELHTFRSKGCFNFRRAIVHYSDQEQFEARNASIAAALAGRKLPADRCANMSSVMLNVWKRRGYAECRDKALRAAWTPERRKAQAKITRDYFSAHPARRLQAAQNARTVRPRLGTGKKAVTCS